MYTFVLVNQKRTWVLIFTDYGKYIHQTIKTISSGSKYDAIISKKLSFTKRKLFVYALYEFSWISNQICRCIQQKFHDYCFDTNINRRYCLNFKFQHETFFSHMITFEYKYKLVYSYLWIAIFKEKRYQISNTKFLLGYSFSKWLSSLKMYTKILK